MGRIRFTKFTFRTLGKSGEPLSSVDVEGKFGEALREIAEREGTGLSEIIRHAITQHPLHARATAVRLFALGYFRETHIDFVPTALDTHTPIRKPFADKKSGIKSTYLVLESEFWAALEDIARHRKLTVKQVILNALQEPTDSNRGSTLRTYALDYFRHTATEVGHAAAGHGSGQSFAPRRHVGRSFTRVPFGDAAALDRLEVR